MRKQLGAESPFRIPNPRPTSAPIGAFDLVMRDLAVFTAAFLLLSLGGRAERVYLLDTLNATAELGWKVHSNQEGGDEWQEETYRSESLNLNHQAFATCMVEHSKLENWLLLPRVDRGEAARLHFEIKFSMRQCQEIPSARTTCKETLKLYALPLKRDEELPAADWQADDRWEFVDTISPKNDEKSQVFVQTSSYAPSAAGVHFAIKDEGACTSILFIKIYYEVCPATTAFLTHFPRTVAGADPHGVQKVTGACAQNATVASANFKRPISLCKSDGTWQLLTGECECDAGYISSRSTNTCAPCGVGSFKPKAGDGECKRCPERSFASGLSSTFCECDTNFYRPFGTSIEQPSIETPGLVIGALVLFALILGFLLVVIVHQRALAKGKHQSDLDVLDNYKQASLTPDYGPLGGKSNFSGYQADYLRKLNVPLIPAYGTGPADVGGHGPLQALRRPHHVRSPPGTRLFILLFRYEDPQEALAEFANEIAPEAVEVTRTIGIGEFGSVCCARLHVENVYGGGTVQQIVAAKTLLPGSSLKARSDFLLEASIMGQFNHPNVIHLVGVVTKSEPAMILTEYMLNGSLDHFLRTNDNGRLTNHKVIQEIQNGFRLPQPMDSPACLYELMLQCWQAERHLRPTFDSIVQQLNLITYHFKSAEINSRNEVDGNASTYQLDSSSVPSLADFLQFSHLGHLSALLSQRGIRTVGQLRALEYGELLGAGVSDYDAQQILCALSRGGGPEGANYDGPFGCSDGRLHADPHTSQQGARSMSRANKTNCSPLLSTSSVLTSHTALDERLQRIRLPAEEPPEHHLPGRPDGRHGGHESGLLRLIPAFNRCL
ncbi:Ephrin type-A receptor 4 isoform X4 [Aphelenchoides fujianensis]|nr:Ephrin type-A receptor 4 isoform X4 [Aphelenchoides fujianensis]